ncbi:MAG: ABC transporter substrate-binding protein [Alkalispirochaeta sp.]
MIRNGRSIWCLVIWLIAVGLTPAPLPGQSSGLHVGNTTHTSSLDISAREHGVTVTISNAWDGAPELTYALVLPGASEPSPDTRDSLEAVVELPVRRIASLATPALAHLADLGALDRVVAVDNLQYVYSRRVLEAAEAGRIVEVGSGAELNLERLIAAEPDVVIASAYGTDDPTVARIQATGIPVIVYADWREHDPLARAEWITLFGVLVERSDRAEGVFAERRRRYRELAELVEESIADRPTIMANAPWQGSWPVPAGDSYVARLFADAGGDYLWADRSGTGSRFLDLESVLSRAAEADFWINLNMGWTGRDDVREADPRLAAFAPYQSRRMYHHNARVRPSGANDFWESGATRPDLVLADLVHILHPDLLPDHDLTYYRRLDR